MTAVLVGAVIAAGFLCALGLVAIFSLDLLRSIIEDRAAVPPCTARARIEAARVNDRRLGCGR